MTQSPSQRSHKGRRTRLWRILTKEAVVVFFVVAEAAWTPHLIVMAAEGEGNIPFEKPPKLGGYDGTTDPNEHIEHIDIVLDYH